MHRASEEEPAADITAGGLDVGAAAEGGELETMEEAKDATAFKVWLEREVLEAWLAAG